MAKKVKISYPNTQALLVDFAADAVRASKLNLGTKTIGKNKTYGVASRTLQKSLAFAVKGSKIEFFAAPPAYDLTRDGAITILDLMACLTLF